MSDSQKEVVRVWKSGANHNSCTMVIPHRFAKEYGFDASSHAVIEKKTNGLLIRRIDL